MEVAASERYSSPPSLGVSLSRPFLSLFPRLPLVPPRPRVPQSLVSTPRPLSIRHTHSHHPFLPSRVPFRSTGWNREGRREWRELTSKAKYNKSRRHCWVTLQREFCRRVGGGGLTAPCYESQSHHPSQRPDRARLDPGFPAFRAVGGGWRETRCERDTPRGDRSKTPPPHIRGSESILSLPSTPARRHARPFSRRRMDIEIRYRLCATPEGTYDGRRVAAAVVVVVTAGRV